MSPTTTRTVADDLDDTTPDVALSYLSALRRRWYVVLLAGIVAAATAYVVSTTVLPTVYRSSATVIVNNQPAAAPLDGGAPTEPFVDDQSLSETFAQLAVQPAVADTVARELGLRPSQLAGRIDVQAVPRTPLVVIAYRAGTPVEAAQGAQAYTAEFVQSSQSTSFLPGRVLVVSGATLPTEPVAPRPLLNSLVAGIAGLLLGLGVLLARVSVRVAQGSRPARRAGGRREARSLAEWRPREGLHQPAEATPESVNGRRSGS